MNTALALACFASAAILATVTLKVAKQVKINNRTLKNLRKENAEIEKMITQEQLKELNQGQVKLYQKQIQDLRDKGKIEEANALEKQMIQGKDFELSKLQLSAQEKLSAAADKLKDTFAAIVSGPIGGFVSKLNFLFTIE